MSWLSMRSVIVLAVATVTFGPTTLLARESGIQLTPDGKRVLVSKDVAGQRYAIAMNRDDGSVTGNVFGTRAVGAGSTGHCRPLTGTTEIETNG